MRMKPYKTTNPALLQKALDLYRQGKTIKYIACQLRLSRTTVAQAIENANIPKRQVELRLTAERMRQLYRLGFALKDISKELGWHYVSLCRYVKEHIPDNQLDWYYRQLHLPPRQTRWTQKFLQRLAAGKVTTHIRHKYQYSEMTHSWEKLCPECQEFWPADGEFFHASPNSTDGLYIHCRACMATIKKEQKHQNYQRYQEGQQEKTCQRCRHSFPATEEFFFPNKKRKHGLRPYCKTCNRELSREYYQSKVQ